MKRVSIQTFDAFLEDTDLAVIMFGSPTGDATRDQAIEFADAWTKRRDISFGYIDGIEQAALAKSLAIRVLPTTIILRKGKVVARLEGSHCAWRIASAISVAEFADANGRSSTPVPRRSIALLKVWSGQRAASQRANSSPTFSRTPTRPKKAELVLDGPLTVMSS